MNDNYRGIIVVIALKLKRPFRFENHNHKTIGVIFNRILLSFLADHRFSPRGFVGTLNLAVFLVIKCACSHILL